MEFPGEMVVKIVDRGPGLFQNISTRNLLAHDVSSLTVREAAIRSIWDPWAELNHEGTDRKHL